MKLFSIPSKTLHTANRTAALSRLLVALAASVGLASCMTMSGGSVAGGAAGDGGAPTGISGAAEMYGAADYSAAISAYDGVIDSTTATANERRLAYLGKALVYLSDDPGWRSLENAKLALDSASRVATGEDTRFSAETGLLEAAVALAVGSESGHAALLDKTHESGAQMARLKRQLETLAAENKTLLAEQEALNEAIEKLKQLTLGN